MYSSFPAYSEQFLPVAVERLADDPEIVELTESEPEEPQTTAAPPQEGTGRQEGGILKNLLGSFGLQNMETGELLLLLILLLLFTEGSDLDLLILVGLIAFVGL